MMLGNPVIHDRIIVSPSVATSLQIWPGRFSNIPFQQRTALAMRKPSCKAQDGTLTGKERAELEDHKNIDYLLVILKAQAEASLGFPKVPI